MNPDEIIDKFYTETLENIDSSFLNTKTSKKVEFVCRCITNRSPIRFLLSCLIAKIHKSEIDIRKPYTEIGGNDTYSGRFYDERYIERFAAKYKLPCNTTTAFLTPAFRNIDRLLTPDLVLVGKPRQVYVNTLELIDKVFRKEILPEDLAKEILRFLIVIKNENEERMNMLIADLRHSDDILPLSSDQILILLQQHLNCKNSSRLPVLMVSSAYLSVSDKTGETILPLKSHNAADKQTGALGDVEVTLVNDENIVTTYEMKDKKVTITDMNNILNKISNFKGKIDNYIFITTDIIDDEVSDYAKELYNQIGIEIAILDCLGFVKHFLHFFHRQRLKFLNIYQDLVINEPNSSVSQPLKESFLILRKTAESE